MRERTDHLVVLTHALLASGPWTRQALTKRANKVLKSPHCAKELAAEILEVWRLPYPPSYRQLWPIVAEAEALQDMSVLTVERIASQTILVRPPKFEPIQALTGRPIPHLASSADIARWLRVPFEHLEWFADHRRTLANGASERLRHYTHHWQEKRNGGWRLIEAPKPRLKLIQRRILEEILNHVPTHDAAYGFVSGRSCATAAAKHAGEDIVVTVDLRDFFLTTPLRRVYALFRCLGYPHKAARTFTSLCSTSTPRAIAAQHFDFVDTQRHLSRHLPQGAPTSPSLANFAAFGLDRRLAGLARRYDAHYTRYADDLTFSGDRRFAGRVHKFLAAANEIVQDEGYRLNTGKTRIMSRHTRQTVTGIVVNDHINVARADFDRLKATLTNCLRKGPANQNRDAHPDFRAHLDGRIAWVERLNLRRGEKLRRLFDAVAW